MKKFVKILIFVIAGFLLIQLIPIDRTQKPIDNTAQFEEVEKTPLKITALMRNACFDCHSLETEFPDYASIAPISWVVSRHVNDARSEVNFSIWGTYNPDLQRSMMQNAVDVMDNGTMPKKSYIAYHPEANISTAERTLLKNYFQKVLDSGTHKLK